MTFDISPALVAIISLGINSIVVVLMAWIAYKNAQLRAEIKDQGSVLRQVEQQGNSISLEGKRTTAVALELLAAHTKLPEHISKAADARKVYEEAERQIVHKNYPVT